MVKVISALVAPLNTVQFWLVPVPAVVEGVGVSDEVPQVPSALDPRLVPSPVPSEPELVAPVVAVTVVARWVAVGADALSNVSQPAMTTAEDVAVPIAMRPAMLAQVAIGFFIGS